MLAHNHLGGAVLAQVLDFDLGMGAGVALYEISRQRGFFEI